MMAEFRAEIKIPLTARKVIFSVTHTVREAAPQPVHLLSGERTADDAVIYRVSRGGYFRFLVI